jgi:hypothetical protein
MVRFKSRYLLVRVRYSTERDAHQAQQAFQSAQRPDIAGLMALLHAVRDAVQQNFGTWNASRVVPHLVGKIIMNNEQYDDDDVIACVPVWMHLVHAGV